VNELIVVDWYSLFCGRGIDGCVHLFYEMVWSCFERYVPTKFSRGGWKLPWITRELSCLKNKETKVVKKSKERKILCLEDEMIDNCECKHSQGVFLSLREEYQ
jgi:hypothetical protein